MDKNNALERLKKEKEIGLKSGLYHYTQVKFAYNSNKIEGGTLSEDETRYIYETDTINVSDKRIIKVNDIIEVKNHFKCFDYVLETANKELTEDIIKHYHFILKSGTTDSENEWFNVGGYKVVQNTVGGVMTTPVEEVENSMKMLLNNYLNKKSKGIEEIIEFHYMFEKIHPFQDGNGRVGRLIMFKECLKNIITPFIIHDENKKLYYNGLREYGYDKKSLINNCKNEQERYEAIMDYFNVSGKKEKKEIEIKSDKQVMISLFKDIVNKRKEIEEKDCKNKNNKYFEGYYNEIKYAAENIYNFLNNGEIDKNYRDGIVEFKTICKFRKEDLKMKGGSESDGGKRAIEDLEIGFGNALRMMEKRKNEILFTGIDIEKNIQKNGNGGRK
jgi:Fic family protein